MGEIELRQNGGPLVTFDAERLQLLKDQLNPDLTDGELALFAEVCQRVSLDPFARQIYAVKRWNNQLKRKVMTVQTSIDGFRLVAQRTGEYAGQRGPFWCGPDGEWLTDPKGNPRPWLADKPPAAAMVGTLRHGFAEPLSSIARFEAYAQRKQDGGLTSMWSFPRGMGDLMIGKCAEALSLRRAFPQELSGLYIAEEMAQADNPQGRLAPPPLEQETDRPISALNVEALIANCEKYDLDLDAIVQVATDGRTSDPARVLVSEAPALIDAQKVAIQAKRAAADREVEQADDSDPIDAESYEPGEEPF